MISRFLKKLLLLCAIIFAVLSVLTIIYRQLAKRVKFDEDVSIVICGDSHTQSAVNDSILGNSVNISQHSQPYLYTYNVIRTITRNNPQIKTVVLGYSFHNLSQSYDEVTFAERARGDYPKYLPILDGKSAFTLMANNFTGVVRSVPHVCRKMLSMLAADRSAVSAFPFIGSFYKSRKSNMLDSVINKTIERHYRKNGRELGFSRIQKQYLKEIVLFCRDENIRLVLISTPVSKEYFNKIPSVFVEEYYSTFNEIKEDVRFLDFHDMDLPAESFGDGDHINASGAEKLSLRLDSLLRE